MSVKITLQEWAAARYNPPPSLKTLRRLARECRIFPIPEKVGRTYYVDPEARYINPKKRRTYGSEAA